MPSESVGRRTTRAECNFPPCLESLCAEILHWVIRADRNGTRNGNRSRNGNPPSGVLGVHLSLSCLEKSNLSSRGGLPDNRLVTLAEPLQPPAILSKPCNSQSCGQKSSLKGIVHPKIKLLWSFPHPQTCLSSEEHKIYFEDLFLPMKLKSLGSKTTLNPIIFFILL